MTVCMSEMVRPSTASQPEVMTVSTSPRSRPASARARRAASKSCSWYWRSSADARYPVWPMPTMATLAVKHHLASVGAGQTQDVLADVVEYHLPGDGYGAQHPDKRPHGDEVDIGAEAASAVHLDGQIAGLSGGLRGGELRHVSIRGG